jgi:hypothetical protein
MIVKLKSGHARHLYVAIKARRIEQVHRTFSNRGIVIDDRDHRLVRHSDLRVSRLTLFPPFRSLPFPITPTGRARYGPACFVTSLSHAIRTICSPAYGRLSATGRPNRGAQASEQLRVGRCTLNQRVAPCSRGSGSLPHRCMQALRTWWMACIFL